jgi:DNA-binding NtrC family response regulator
MAKTAFKLKILYGECDEEVLAAQTALIQKAGHQVQTAIGRKGVQDALRGGGFDLVLLGPTLTRDDRHHLPYMVKKAHAGTRVLVMHSDGARHHEVDANIDTGARMEVLLEKVAALMGQEALVSK